MTFTNQTLQSTSDCGLACLDFIRQAAKDLNQLRQRVVPGMPFTSLGDRENGGSNRCLATRAAYRLCC